VERPSGWSPWRLGLLWLAGIDLRVTLLATSPVLPLIRQDLGLDETAIGALSTLPVLLLGIAAIPGAALIARIGARRALVTGLLIIGVSSALRGIGPSTPILFVTTFAMGAGIAMIQPSFPSLVAEWFPGRVGLATATYSNGLLAGEMLGAGLTLPVVLPLVHGSWSWSFVVWAIPVLATALLVAIARPSARRGVARARVGWWPNWHESIYWRLGLMQAGVSALYFGAITFIPDYAHALGQPELVGPALTALNAAQIPASAGLVFAAGRLVGRKAPLLAAALAGLAGLVGMVVLPPIGMVACAALQGFAGALALVLVLALPPLVARPGDVHRVSAAMFSLGYTSAFVVSVAGGALWDATHVPAAAFAPAALGALVLVVGAATLPTRQVTLKASAAA